MTYMENIFICMASPLLIAALCMGKRHTGAFLFCFAGMGMCLLSAYLNTFLAALYLSLIHIYWKTRREGVKHEYRTS